QHIGHAEASLHDVGEVHATVDDKSTDVTGVGTPGGAEVRITAVHPVDLTYLYQTDFPERARAHLPCKLGNMGHERIVLSNHPRRRELPRPLHELFSLSH